MATQSWGIVTTLKAGVEETLAFTAHHLSLGPAGIWLYFDDPADPAADAVEALGLTGRINVIRCDAAYWQRQKAGRPERHQSRQGANLRRAYRRSKLDWIAHIDVDEFLVADRPVADCLEDCQREYFRVQPYEAMHEPGLEDDIFSARHFHRPTRSAEEGRAVAKLHGRYAGMLQKGMLSHPSGKCFFRTGLEAFTPAIHSAKLLGERLTYKGFMPGLSLLHFHAQDPERWINGLSFRLSRGAYQAMPALRDFLSAASDAEIADFYKTVMKARPEALALFEAHDMLRVERLELRAKVAALQALTPPVAQPS